VRRAGITGVPDSFGTFAAAHACSMVGFCAGDGARFPQAISANENTAPVAKRRRDGASILRFARQARTKSTVALGYGMFS